MKEYDKWVIASKNVSLIVEKREDLSYYNGDRYFFATHIAEQWFMILDKFKEE